MWKMRASAPHLRWLNSRALTSLVLIAVLLRAFLPAGVMPVTTSDDRGWGLVLCIVPADPGETSQLPEAAQEILEFYQDGSGVPRVPADPCEYAPVFTAAALGGYAEVVVRGQIGTRVDPPQIVLRLATVRLNTPPARAPPLA